MDVVGCCGAPRDLGRDLGLAHAAEIRAALAASGARGWRAWLRRDPGAARLHRELRRYFPHQSEWLEGLALGARVPLRALVRALAESCGPATPAPVAIAARSAGAARLALAAPPGARLRRVEPEGRFRSLELGNPTVTWAWLGVNDAGLAVAALPRLGGGAGAAPPFALFSRDCLERFERVDAALEWCLARHAAPGGALLFADASGDLAGVDAGPSQRRTLRPSGDWLALGGDAELLAKPASAPHADFESALAAALAAAAPAQGPAAIADPEGRRLRVGTGPWLDVAV